MKDGVHVRGGGWGGYLREYSTGESMHPEATDLSPAIFFSSHPFGLSVAGVFSVNLPSV